MADLHPSRHIGQLFRGCLCWELDVFYKLRTPDHECSRHLFHCVAVGTHDPAGVEEQ